MRATLAPLAVRAVVAVAGVGLVVVPAHLHPVPLVLTLLGVLLALVAPTAVGPSLATAGFVIAWIASSGWHGTPGDTRTVLAAAALYVFHTAAALTPFLPLGADVDRAVLRRWLARCGLPVVVAAVVIAVDLALPRHSGSPLYELAGLGGAVLVAGLVTRGLWRPSRAGEPPDPAR